MSGEIQVDDMVEVVNNWLSGEDMVGKRGLVIPAPYSNNGNVFTVYFSDINRAMIFWAGELKKVER